MEVLYLFFSAEGLDRRVKYGIIDVENEEEVGCVKKLLICLVLLLILSVPALAEEVPTLPGQFILRDLPADKTFTVYTGPGEEYLVAAKGKAKVSTNDTIRCFGRLEDWWVLVEYGVSGSQRRIGCIDLSDHMETIDESRMLPLADQSFLLTNPIALTDDPNGSAKSLGKISGEVTLLAYKNPDWAYVEGELDGQPVRGFLPERSLIGCSQHPDLPQTDDPSLHLTGDFSLSLKKGAKQLSVHSLSGERLLLIYRMPETDELFLRVTGQSGQKKWTQTISDDGCCHAVAVTDEGFLLDIYDRSVTRTGRRYTYRISGSKWQRESFTDPDAVHPCKSAEAPALSAASFTADNGFLYAVLCTGYNTYITRQAPDGTAAIVRILPGRLIWSESLRAEEAGFRIVLETATGYLLQEYEIIP